MTGLLDGTTVCELVREPPARIAAIVIIGATCSGKTTLASAVRAAAIAGVDVPQRFVTRAPRTDDVVAEARYLDAAALDAAIAAGTVGICWSRTLEPGHTERYAFAAPAPGLLPVYSANNAICTHAQPPDSLRDALVVGVRAPDELRDARLRKRSPSLVACSPDEVRARLAESSDASRRYAHVVIDNSDVHEAAAHRDIVTLVRNVLGNRRG
ncbi:MAG TPA: hypothetical protein VL326_36845 [Kofleriaceae bacterium]|jgi:ribose 1,5-bisphosphokinase PhnN|nr:hypothetical protein [Kofleriaceae bacterium]